MNECVFKLRFYALHIHQEDIGLNQDFVASCKPDRRPRRCFQGLAADLRYIHPQRHSHLQGLQATVSTRRKRCALLPTPSRALLWPPQPHRHHLSRRVARKTGAQPCALNPSLARPPLPPRCVTNIEVIFFVQPSAIKTFFITTR